MEEADGSTSSLGSGVAGRRQLICRDKVVAAATVIAATVVVMVVVVTAVAEVKLRMKAIQTSGSL